jgi:hypothetical protein
LAAGSQTAVVVGQIAENCWYWGWTCHPHIVFMLSQPEKPNVSSTFIYLFMKRGPINRCYGCL